ncbi:hypothetical protein ACFWWC_19675 [Streptomyces sp. NPDC058642]|uniref:hypothetical protein n=1 Tax=Streptomyces sp. NPDC058642 TaxID=3346572 RepID=UPI0036550A9A
MINRKTTFVGRFHCGQGSWRVSTGTEEVATVIGQLFGRQSTSQDSHEADHFEVLPQSTSMRVVISGPESIKAGLLTAALRYEPQPSTRLSFRLADAPALGGFRLSSPSWDLAESVPTLRTALSETDGDALCELVAETVEFTTRDGVALSYCRPSIKIIGPWHKADQHAT